MSAFETVWIATKVMGYMIILAYLCAPNVWFRLTTKSSEPFLHAVLYWILLIISIFIFFFMRTMLVVTTTTTTSSSGGSMAAGQMTAGGGRSTAKTASKKLDTTTAVVPPPPPPTFAPISASTWSLPHVSFPAPALPSSTPLPSFLPPVKPSIWTAPADFSKAATPAAAAAPAPAPAVGSTPSPSSYALAAPSPCTEEDCIPLPAAAAAAGAGTGGTAAAAPLATSAKKTSLPSAFNNAEWAHYFQPFPPYVMENLITVLQRKSENETARIMFRLSEMKDKHASQETVQNYILALS
jgi:hypothetical protein